ncbi:MAG: hypothetical protein R3F62_09030 [Planctomycetota bacterium]
MRAAAWLVLPVLATSGCTVFTDYNSSTEDARQAFERGQFGVAYKAYSEDLDATNDSLLYHLEAGTSAHVGQMYAQSLPLFDKAYDKVVEYQNQALAMDALQLVGSVTVNEKTIPYSGAVFEQILMQAYNARNDFLRGNLGDVWSHVLHCWELQEKAREIYKKELAAYEEESQRKQSEEPQLDVGDVRAKMVSAYDYGDLSTAEDVYEINFVRYLNAWLVDAISAGSTDDQNEAWLDLGYVLERFENVEFIRRDWARLADASGARNDARELREKWNMEPLPKNYGSVTLFFECGMGPHLEEFGLIFPTYKGAAKFAMPIYKTTPNPVSGAVLRLGQHSQRSVVLSDVDKIAFRYHQDRLPIMIAKQIIRLVIKIGIQSGGTIAIEQVTKGTKNEGVGQLAALGFSALTSAWNVISEQADLRCWRTLPQTYQVARVYLPEGAYPCKIDLVGGGSYDLGTLVVEGGKHRMINARSLQRKLYWHVPAVPYDGVESSSEANSVRIDLTQQE